MMTGVENVNTVTVEELFKSHGTGAGSASLGWRISISTGERGLGSALWLRCL